MKQRELSLHDSVRILFLVNLKALRDLIVRVWIIPPDGISNRRLGDTPLRSFSKWSCSTTLIFLLGFISFGAAQTDPNVEARRKALDDLLSERWEYAMRTNPIFASTI